MVDLVYHGAVRSVRKTDGNAIVGLIKSMMQTVMMVLVFYVMLSLIGMRGAAIRGDYFLYLLSGVFMFMTHAKTVGAVAASEGPTSPMMQHAPMNTIIAIASAALGALLTQTQALILMLFAYHVAVTPVEIHDPLAAFGMVLVSWYTGIGVGLVVLALQPWLPTFTNTAKTLYVRINLFASGKLMVGNTIPFWMLPFFVWNPLFHVIDQGRGHIFLNYTPHYSSATYPILVGTTLIALGLIAENYTRRHASASWYAKR